MASKKDHNLIHDMSKGLKENSSKSKIRIRLEELKNAIKNKNIQGNLSFDSKDSVQDILIDKRDPQSIKIAEIELAKIRKRLKP